LSSGRFRQTVGTRYHRLHPRLLKDWMILFLSVHRWERPVELALSRSYSNIFTQRSFEVALSIRRSRSDEQAGNIVRLRCQERPLIIRETAGQVPWMTAVRSLSTNSQHCSSFISHACLASHCACRHALMYRAQVMSRSQVLIIRSSARPFDAMGRGWGGVP